MKSHKKNGSFLISLHNATIGIMRTLRDERNMKIHWLFAIMISHIVIVFYFDRSEKVVFLFLIAAIFFAELVNTSFEALTDLITEKQNGFVQIIKDAMSGAVLVLALTALTIFCVIIQGYYDYVVTNSEFILLAFCIGLVHTIFSALLLFRRTTGFVSYLVFFLGLILFFLQMQDSKSIIFSFLLFFLYLSCMLVNVQKVKKNP